MEHINNGKESYKTIKEAEEAEIKRKNSKFIARAFPIKSEEEAEKILAKIKKEYRDASHVCYSYRISRKEGIIEHFDDAGEPAQSAGPPILNHIKGFGLLNVLVVVIRYFGGVKLGVGGLIRAYGDGAKLVLNQAKVITKVATERLKLRYPYLKTGKVMNLINRYGATIEKTEYLDLPILTIRVEKSKADILKEALVEASKGKVEFWPVDA